RGLETHVVDPRPWALADVADPDIMQPVEESWAELGVKTHFNTAVEAFVGDGAVRAVKTSQGALPAGVGGASMAPSAPGVFAAGDCVELPHNVTKVPVVGLSGSHAYAQGKVAGTSAAGGGRLYAPGNVPWGLVAGRWVIG